MLLAAILLAATWQRARWLSATLGLLLVGLLFTYSRTTIAALAVGLVVLARALRSWWPVAAPVVLVGVGVAFVQVYPDIGPETRFTPAELEIQRAGGRENPTSGDPLDPDESSIDSHWDSLREGAETVARHPQGYGVGNAGVTASRTGGDVKAGESTYTELGVDLGLLGALAFIAWNLALLRALLRQTPWLEREVTARPGVRLAKVDVDANPALAARYRVSGIPAVKAFRNGEVVGEFVGAQPPAAVARFLDELTGPSPLERLLDDLRERGDFPEIVPALERGDHELALRVLIEELPHADGDRRERTRELMVLLFSELAKERPRSLRYRRKLAATLY